jgi:hypothetical protein
VYGNGGKSGHQRACRTWKERKLARLDENVADIDAGRWGSSLSPVVVEHYRHTYALEAARLREELKIASR